MNSLTRGLSLSLLCTVSTGAFAQTDDTPSAVEWMHDLDAGFAHARSRHLPVMIDFYADWCGPCKAMDRDVWTDGAVGEAARGLVAIRIDFDRARVLRRRYRVSSIPQMIFTDSWGNELGRMVGFESVEAMLDMFDILPESFAPVAGYHDRLEADSKDAEAWARLGTFYRSRKLLAAADVFFEKAIKTSKKGKRHPEAAAEAFVGLGLNRLDRREFKKACDPLEELVKRLRDDPHRPYALYGLVVARLQLGDMKKAKRHFEQLAREYPDFRGLADAEKRLSSASRQNERSRR